MKKSKEDLDDQKWFEEQMRDAVSQLDTVHPPRVPTVRQLEALVDGQKQVMRIKLWRELLLLWLSALFILFVLLWIINRSPVWFAVLQGMVALGAGGYVSVRYGLRRAGLWRN